MAFIRSFGVVGVVSSTLRQQHSKYGKGKETVCYERSCYLTEKNIIQVQSDAFELRSAESQSLRVEHREQEAL